MTKKCRVCSAPHLKPLVDFGPQALSNRFLKSKNEVEYKHWLALGICRKCGIAQLATPAPVNEIRTRFDWIRYREPEDHLDKLTELLTKLPGVNENSAIWGVSSIEDSMLRRFQERGFKSAVGCQPLYRFEGKDKPFGIETVQDLVAKGELIRIARERGTADIIIARRILEHSYEPMTFLARLQDALSLGGRLVFEVPDSQRAIKYLDYTMAWEERLCYLVSKSLKRMLLMAGFSIDGFYIFPYPMEDALVAIVSKSDKKRPTLSSPTAEFRAAQKYSKGFPFAKKRFQNALRRLRKKSGPIALMGAGHIGSFFINAFGLSRWIDFIVDDDPMKQQYRMPGSRLPIRGSESLRQGLVKTCLLGVGPGSEKKIMERNQAFLDQGGKFLSIFSSVKNPAVPFLGAVGGK